MSATIAQMIEVGASNSTSLVSSSLGIMIIIPLSGYVDILIITWGEGIVQIFREVRKRQKYWAFDFKVYGDFLFCLFAIVL